MIRIDDLITILTIENVIKVSSIIILYVASVSFLISVPKLLKKILDELENKHNDDFNNPRTF